VDEEELGERDTAFGKLESSTYGTATRWKAVEGQVTGPLDDDLFHGAYLTGDYSVSFMSTRSGGFARILPSASLASRALIHSGSSRNAFQLRSAAS